MESEKNMPLTTYAVLPQTSRGRMYPDFGSDFRSPFQRDRDRLIHSAAFRRLDGKTQVFAYHEGKNYRTRLTHSIEVAQITRAICQELGLNQDLGEAIALAHDLGHSPFGHAGERGLQNAMAEFGGFDHNVHSLKIMTLLERRYPNFAGLNLTWETLEGTVKHNGPIVKATSPYLRQFNRKFDLDLKHYSSLESQVASFADDIAYNNHDIDDGFRAGFFSIEQLRSLPFAARILDEFDHAHKDSRDDIRIYAITRSLISEMIKDLIAHTTENIRLNRIKTVEDVRRAGAFTAGFSPAMQHNIDMLRQFLKQNFYTATPIVRMDLKSTRITEELFAVFMHDFRLLPPTVRNTVPAGVKPSELAEIVCAYIAGMTDMGAIEEHQKLFDAKCRF